MQATGIRGTHATHLAGAVPAGSDCLGGRRTAKTTGSLLAHQMWKQLAVWVLALRSSTYEVSAPAPHCCIRMLACPQRPARSRQPSLTYGPSVWYAFSGRGVAMLLDSCLDGVCGAWCVVTGEGLLEAGALRACPIVSKSGEDEKTSKVRASCWANSCS